jgi:mannose-6-phosphate isomerase-like protein (cupin superfamily)
MNYKEERPWGNFENLLDNNICKVKRITIYPEQSPSYQYHNKREEFWVIVSGVGRLILDEVSYMIKTGDMIHIPLMAKHQIINTSKEELVFIEVQMGEYMGEDDIVRLSDRYGRL